MATTKDIEVQPLMKDVQQYITNPQAVQSVVIDHTEAAFDGRLQLVDATNPFATLLGLCSSLVAAGCQSYIPILRKEYPNMAETPDDLYHHMSDKHYVDRFATPAIQKVMVLVSYTELLARAALMPDGSKSAVIRKYSSTEVDGVRFSLLYPVVIRIAANGIITVRYDLSKEHPLQVIGSDVIYWTKRVPTSSEQTSFLQLELDMLQLAVKTVHADINPSTGVNKNLEFDNSYCYARVLFKKANETVWREMVTTHSEMVYNKAVPTALLRVTPGNLNIKIPLVYFSQGLVSGKMRVEIFTSQGEVFLNTTAKQFENFTNDWGSENGDPLTVPEAAFKSVVAKNFFFSGITSGGTGEVPFEVLKQRVIDGSFGSQKLPITPAQIVAAGESMGFSIKTHVDTVTERQFLASKSLPPSRDRELITPGSASIETVLTTTGHLKSSPWVADNGARITITPDALWKNVSGVVEMVSAQELTDLWSKDTESTLSAINSSNYLSSPFYYVLDSSGDKFVTRAYHFNESKALVERFVGSNESTGMIVEIDGITLTNTGNGWSLVISTLSNDAWKAQAEVYKIAQLNFTAPGIGGLAAVNGVYEGTGSNGEDIFSFNLTSGYDVDSNHKLSLLSLHAFTEGTREVFTDLSQLFNVVFVTGAPMPAGLLPNALDNKIVRAQLPVRANPVFAQQVKLDFGKALSNRQSGINLWTASRTLAPATSYLRHEADVFDVYAEDVYEINPENGTSIWFDASGNMSTKLLHSAGEQRLDSAGNPIVLFPKGSIVYDSGVPVPVSPDSLQRQFDILLLEGSYYFATDASTVEYVREMTEVLANYITVDLPELAKGTLDKSKIYFHPKVTMGLINVVVDGGIVMQIQSAQSLTVRLGARQSVVSNLALTEALKRITIEQVDNYFDNEVLSISDLTTLLKSVYGDDVLSVSITGFGGQAKADAITMLNPNERCSLKKRVVVLDSGEFTVREAITVDIFQH